jgi:hypothetical protein
LRSMLEGAVWYSSAMSVDEAFALWVASKLEQAGESQWVFDLLRVSERKYLCESLGIERSIIVGKTPKELADAVLQKVGLPVFRVFGNVALIDSWTQLIDLVDNEEDERSVVLSRQRAERLLRKILFFYCSNRYGPVFVKTLENPGTLRVPKRLTDEMGVADHLRESRIANLFTEDGWADLGFLAMALRKFSERLGETRASHVSGAPLKLFTVAEYDAFSKLGTALQPYAHDRPSKMESMHQELRDALLEIKSAILDMNARGVLPEEVLVLETCTSVLGGIFKVFRGKSSTRHYRCQATPQIGSAVLVLPSTDRDYARCEWTVSPWQS